MQDAYATSPLPSSRFQLYNTAKHHVTKGRYITSNDARGYIPVFEYPLNGQWIMMDIDDGYVLWTGIWKALGNSKADIVKMVDSHPELASVIRRVRGGYLKIQGTWMPYEVALRLARRVAWPIREDLVPLFGPSFPDSCLSPDQPGFGKLLPSSGNRRRARRAPQTVQRASEGSLTGGGAYRRFPAEQAHVPRVERNTQMLAGPGGPRVVRGACSISSGSVQSSPRQAPRHRYSPYGSPSLDQHRRQPSTCSIVSSSFSVPSTPLSFTSVSPTHRGRPTTAPTVERNITLPPLRVSYPTSPAGALPSISSLDASRTARLQDPAEVLRRLTSTNDDSLSPSPPPAPYSGSSRASRPALNLDLPSIPPCTPSPISPSSPETPHSLTQLVPLSTLEEKARVADLSRHTDAYSFGRSEQSFDGAHHIPLRPW